MTNKYVQHIPTFCEGFTPKALEFSTTEELVDFLEVPIEELFKSGSYIMHVTDDGFHHWFLGTVTDPYSVNLPVWGGGKYLALLDGEEVILGKEVVRIYGDELTLADGRIATRLKYSRSKNDRAK